MGGGNALTLRRIQHRKGFGRRESRQIYLGRLSSLQEAQGEPYGGLLRFDHQVPSPWSIQSVVQVLTL